MSSNKVNKLFKLKDRKEFLTTQSIESQNS